MQPTNGNGHALVPVSDLSTAPLATRSESSALAAFTPRNIDEALTLARTYAASKILGAYGTPEQVMLIMGTGAELGIPATAALRGLYVVEGRVFMSADLMVALCLRAPQCERFDLVEQTDESAAYTVQRRDGAPLTFRFTLADAKRALLGGKETSNWGKYPGTMCRHRAAAIAARALFPDVIMGLYDESERDEGEQRQRAAIHAEVVPMTQPTPAPAKTAETMAKWVAELETALRSARSEEDAKPTIATIRQAFEKESPERKRLAAILAERKAAKWAAEPAHDADGVVIEREPGEEG